jgi:hypothetical protein
MVLDDTSHPANVMPLASIKRPIDINDRSVPGVSPFHPRDSVSIYILRREPSGVRLSE